MMMMMNVTYREGSVVEHLVGGAAEEVRAAVVLEHVVDRSLYVPPVA